MQPKEEELEQLKLLLFSQDEDNYELALQILRGLNVERWNVWTDLRRCTEFFNEHWYTRRDVPTLLRELRKRQLALSSRNLTYLPDFLTVLAPMIQVANLAYNQLTHAPSVLFHYNNLRELDLSNNYLSEIDEVLFLLPALQALHLTGNRLHRLPAGILEAKNLRKLWIGNFERGLIQLPDGFEKMESLRVFSYWGRLDKQHAQNTIPRILTMPNIENLTLTFSDFSEEHCSFKGISKMRELRRLYVRSCTTNFDEWAGELCELPKLELIESHSFLNEKQLATLVGMLPQLKVRFF